MSLIQFSRVRTAVGMALQDSGLMSDYDWPCYRDSCTNLEELRQWLKAIGCGTGFTPTADQFILNCIVSEPERTAQHGSQSTRTEESQHQGKDTDFPARTIRDVGRDYLLERQEWNQPQTD